MSTPTEYFRVCEELEAAHKEIERLRAELEEANRRANAPRSRGW